MLIAVFTTFAASRKEPLADTVERIHAAFLTAGFGEPTIRFTMSDPPGSAELSAVQAVMGTKRVSSIERVLKRWTQLERFARAAGTAARGGRGGATMRVLSNLTESGALEPVDFAILTEIARGVPKSFPCHRIALHFSAAGFSEGPPLPASPDPRTISMLARAGVDVFAGQPTSPGISVTDSWWVNGRQRSLGALRLVEADPSAKKLPAPPAQVAALFAACGKVRKTMQVPFASAPAAAQAPGFTAAAREARSAAPRGVAGTETGEAIRAVVRAYRARMSEFLERLPHDLPHHDASVAAASATLTGTGGAGPKKPALVDAFAPLGYDCRGESGTFTLQRQTPKNLTVKLQLDVGTWHSSVTAFMQVIGMVNGQGFKATLALPASRQAARGMVRGQELFGQFPIGGPERWRQIVENLAALVAELDRSFVPEIEAIAGPSPEWFRPETA